MYDFVQKIVSLFLSTFQAYYIKSGLFIANPQIFLKLDQVFYFFQFFFIFFFETAVLKSRLLTILRFWIFQLKYVNQTRRNRI